MKHERRITFTVDEKFQKEVKFQAVREDMTIRELAVKALKEYLTRSKTKV